jgi:hypothetical protein
MIEYIATFTAAFIGTMLGGYCGLYLGSRAMIAAVKEAFAEDDK